MTYQESLRANFELSAKAEVVRRPGRGCPRWRRALREGGGGPQPPTCAPHTAGSSPRRRRWSARHAAARPADDELSAKAEVVRPRPSAPRRTARALREGGGGPKSRTFFAGAWESSPRRRRWSARVEGGARRLCELSAKAEVVRRGRSIWRLGARALREGGGGPDSCPRSVVAKLSSPRRRRWSGGRIDLQELLPELSAKAEVVRPLLPLAVRPHGALREGGGGPASALLVSGADGSSPRRRRWSGRGYGGRVAGGELFAKAEVVRSGSTR